MAPTETQPAQEDSVKGRIGRFDAYYDARTFSYNLRKTSKPKKVNTRGRKYALIVRRIIDEKGRYRRTTIDIKSDALCHVLIDINDGVEGLELAKHEPEAEPSVLFHSYGGLVERLGAEQVKEPRDESLISDIQAAIHLVEDDQGEVLSEMATLIPQRKITWKLLWALFKPNTLVFNYHQLTEQAQVLLVRDTWYGERMDKSKYLLVRYEIIHCDGNSFGYTRLYLEIDEYQGLRDITDLPAYPLEYHVHREEIYHRAIELGKVYAQMPAHSYHEVSGQAMRDRQLQDRDQERAHDPDDSLEQYELKTREKFFTSGRVMISPVAFRRFEPNSTYNPPVHRQLQRDNLSDDQYAICTPVLLGFSFDRKSWGGFAMSRLRDVVWNEGAFNALVLGEKQKTLIHGLVRQHAIQGDAGFDDVIKGKGRGLIGLLVGTPGCGKTLTAEAVAETTRRPLYAVSVGELGTTPDTVEARLLRVLDLAQMWNAVLLLDEAEVFLQRRSSRDINRNALVSIFLRQLEYYQGVMILTTNMAEQCDHAFESRIHFSVYYPELDKTARRVIWANFFKNLSLEVSDTDLDELAAHRINGRQIKNAFSSAQTIALANGSPHLTLKDINVVLSVLHDWQLAVAKSSSTVG